MSFFIDNDNEVVIPELTDQDGNAVTGATVTATVFKSDGSTQVGGVSQPISLTDDGNGKYSAVVDKGINVSTGDLVKIKFVATKGDTDATFWRDEYVLRR